MSRRFLRFLGRDDLVLNTNAVRAVDYIRFGGTVLGVWSAAYLLHPYLLQVVHAIWNLEQDTKVDLLYGLCLLFCPTFPHTLFWHFFLVLHSLAFFSGILLSLPSRTFSSLFPPTFQSRTLPHGSIDICFSHSSSMLHNSSLGIVNFVEHWAFGILARFTHVAVQAVFLFRTARFIPGHTCSQPPAQRASGTTKASAR